ncbi:hypothetical protein [Sulfurimonas sp. HSL3-7]|uniref:hypothetical protein n=1 Tax=Sulfonitrofixus jiaomeiensis TaxID=3131938 RepID=UPI0031F7CC6C
MKKFNLLKEIIVISREALLKAINTNKEFAVSYRGDVVYPPYGEKEIFVFRGTASAPKASALTLPRAQTISDILGKEYKVVEDEDRVLIKAAGNWQALIGINTPNSDYDDTTGDGISEFADEQLEEMGWHATDFNIDYRAIVSHLEENVDGVLFCIERDEPYQFSGLGYIFDIENARRLTFAYCQNIIKEKLANDPDFAPDNLTDDEEQVARFFECL